MKSVFNGLCFGLGGNYTKMIVSIHQGGNSERKSMGGDIVDTYKATVVYLLMAADII